VFSLVTQIFCYPTVALGRLCGGRASGVGLRAAARLEGLVGMRPLSDSQNTQSPIQTLGGEQAGRLKG
jgi:hypothetical protein